MPRKLRLLQNDLRDINKALGLMSDLQDITTKISKIAMPCYASLVMEKNKIKGLIELYE